MVVHDVNGDRVACGQLYAPLIVSRFEQYPGYTGSLVVEGTMTVGEMVYDAELTSAGQEATQLLNWTLSGTDPNCMQDRKSGIPNACGIHIHEGTDCSNASTIGGHRWDKNAIKNDPWAPVQYVSVPDRDGTLTLRLNSSWKVTTGFKNKDQIGHVMVVHDSTGARVACGQVHAPSTSILPGPHSSPEKSRWWLGIVLLSVLLSCMLCVWSWVARRGSGEPSESDSEQPVE